MNIIVTNIGRRGYLVSFLKEINWFDGKVYVSDCDNTASGLYSENDGYFILPKPVENEKLYIECLIDLCVKEQIKLVIPVIDPEIYILSKYKNSLKENGIFVLVSNNNVLDICYNKLKMNDFLRKIGMNVIDTYENIKEFERAYMSKKVIFPVIVKPILGSGSINTYKVDKFDELKYFFKEGMIIQKYIEGIEYGADVFNDFKGNLLRTVIKKKIQMRSGETDKSITVTDDFILDNLMKVSDKLKHIGNIDCDIIKDAVTNEIYIIDLNPRFGGGYLATHLAGVNLLELTLRLCLNEDIKPEFNNYIVNRLVMKDVGFKISDL